MKTKNKNFKEILDSWTWWKVHESPSFLFQTDEIKTEDRYEELFESYLYNQTQLLITFIILVLLVKLTM